MWLLMIYHRPFKVLLKYQERIRFRHQGSDLEENGAETLLRLCACTHIHMHVYFCMNSILYRTFTEKDQAEPIFKATAWD